MKADAIILAGAPNDGRLMSVSDEPWEALIPLRGKPMIRYVMEALAASPSVGPIIVVGPVDALREADIDHGIPDVRFVPSQGRMMDNLSAGAAHATPGEHVLIVTADIPLLTADAVEDFIAKAKLVDADLYYPVVTKESSEEAFPGVRRTYVTLKDGVFTGGNLALLRPEIVPACHHVIAQAIAMRKNPLKMSRLLGFKFIIKFAMKRLTMREIENRVQEVLGFHGLGVMTSFAEIGIDVDKPEDYDLIDARLRAMGETTDVGTGHVKAD